MTAPAIEPGPTRLDRILALLDSDHLGEAAAAGRALRRLLAGDASRLNAPAPPGELAACMDFAVDAIAHLTREIEALRRDNARLRACSRTAARRPGAPHAAAGLCYTAV
jgi:hypothetical protein